MLAIQIASPSLFMKQLLTTEEYSPFLLQEASISTAYNYTINGRLLGDFFAQEGCEPPPAEDKGYAPWSVHKPLILQILKGRRRPLSLKLILLLSTRTTEEWLAPHLDPALYGQIASVSFQIRYSHHPDSREESLRITTGISYHSFQLSKEAEALWDAAFLRFLDQAHLEYLLL